MPQLLPGVSVCMTTLTWLPRRNDGVSAPLR